MTPERFARIHEVLATRQPDLTVCMEEVHKPNNISAIIRTADAVGVHQVHAVWPRNSKMRTLGGTSAGARNWVDVVTHDNTPDAFAQLKAQGMQILVTNLSERAVDFREIDYTKPTAIVLGQEKTGISQQALEMADQDIIIPMVGMVQSLNVSVASALILYEAQRQRQNAGMYQRTRTLIPQAEVDRILFERGHPVLAKVAKRKGLPYPVLDEEGQIAADDAWWAQMQAAR
ncbi:tRNA (guanosine(18)-2'-O)-methyltransferase TrmH [Enterovibrio norvegicus]|uniref:tRNA (guanosine(18)-2'-O)-methyltransferase n=1 Tax=Enterovibrio norvegicus TaxID=188144 RepID=A0A2N7LED0_9GAMM|nr:MULTISPECIES: tRNA (guanosine(18)-2'-O)-methyltransferase TrmH [Enterovibrio]MBE1276040.1 tRNA (guanosine(18)-2'-O)-methyltransferase TrmH [Enterovibrio baiacu]MCC4800078.1 tRNA (guanosine(18)-2'-O)-methyltransferase TrmH [Enterovibrio norvegicus]OEE45636.1 tRNA (guanosine(18)-2'-O)-methyltransferase TrmH [Enterovibrio norvegicus]OEF53282.1 tRNA (guanosine(18)-2'-O)-methyltransferase TrmH [Enterovibrio norvegicus]OEF60307.1 tRNA (guanosine(18)-2'-O)-methyltransferase TrmH [Enterovibrio norv